MKMVQAGSVQASWAALCSGQYALRMLVLAGGVALYAITSYVVFIISPSIVKELGGESYYAWIAMLFVTASLVATVLAPKLLHRVGPRRAYAVAASIFAAGSIGCGLAPSMPFFLLARLIEGVGCGFMLALSYAMVQILYPQALWSRALSVINGNIVALCGIDLAEESSQKSEDISSLRVLTQRSPLCTCYGFGKFTFVYLYFCIIFLHFAIF